MLEQATLGVMPDVQRILDAMLAISSDLELQAVMRRIVEVACEQTGARYGAVGVLAAATPDGEVLLSEFVTEGIDATVALRIGHPPSGRGILGLVIRNPRPLRLEELETHPDSVGFPPGHPAMRTFLGVPIRTRDTVFGNLYLTEKRGGPFTAGDEAIAVALASAAGVAIENARLHEHVQELALLHDRERIARDLHDSVIQRLFATALGLQALSRVAGDLGVADKIQVAVDDLDATIREIRSVIFELSSSERGLSGCRARVLALVAETTPVLGFAPHVGFDGPVDTIVGAELSEQLLVALRELLSNVVRHARAGAVAISVRAGLEVVLTVEDDGIGMKGALGPGLGLANLSERARALGGSFALDADRPRGVRAVWSVPRESRGTS